MATKVEHDGKAKSLRVIRNVYLYLVAMIGLITFVFGSIGIIDNVLKNYIFQVDESYYYAEPVTGRGGICTQAYLDPLDTTGKKMVQPTAVEIDECEKRYEEQRKVSRNSEIGREFSISIAQILIGLPLWLFHWGIIQREYRRKTED